MEDLPPILQSCWRFLFFCFKLFFLPSPSLPRCLYIINAVTLFLILSFSLPIYISVGYILLVVVILLFTLLVGSTVFSNWWLSYWLGQGSGVNPPHTHSCITTHLTHEDLTITFQTLCVFL